MSDTEDTYNDSTVVTDGLAVLDAYILCRIEDVKRVTFGLLFIYNKERFRLDNMPSMEYCVNRYGT